MLEGIIFIIIINEVLTLQFCNNFSKLLRLDTLSYEAGTGCINANWKHLDSLNLPVESHKVVPICFDSSLVKSYPYLLQYTKIFFRRTTCEPEGDDMHLRGQTTSFEVRLEIMEQ